MKNKKYNRFILWTMRCCHTAYCFDVVKMFDPVVLSGPHHTCSLRFEF